MQLWHNIRPPRTLFLTACILIGLVLACNSGENAEITRKNGETTDSADRTSVKPHSAFIPPRELITARVNKARQRMLGSAGGRLLWESIEAHGGLEHWFANGPLHFRFAYSPVQGREPIDTRQQVYAWSSLARHQVVGQAGMEFGWNGQNAWKMPPDAELPVNARFWALTPYYFVGIPFVLADPGVQYSLADSMEFEGRQYKLVRADFGAGVGDAPDDYYIVLIDPETKRTAGVRYIVSYPGYFTRGEHSPEKLMMYDGRLTLGGLVFPERFRTFSIEAGTPNRLVTHSTLSEMAFKPELAASHFLTPAGAAIIEGLGKR